MEIDVLKYAPVIARVLAKLKVSKNQREDMTQECYVALLEKQKHLVHGLERGEDDKFAASICWSRIQDVRRKVNQNQPGHKTQIKAHLDSMSDPRVYRKVAKIGIPAIDDDPEVTSEEMEAAVLSLPFEEYRVIYELYVEGKT